MLTLNHPLNSIQFKIFDFSCYLFRAWLMTHSCLFWTIMANSGGEGCPLHVWTRAVVEHFYHESQCSHGETTSCSIICFTIKWDRTKWTSYCIKANETRNMLGKNIYCGRKSHEKLDHLHKDFFTFGLLFCCCNMRSRPLLAIRKTVCLSFQHSHMKYLSSSFIQSMWVF